SALQAGIWSHQQGFMSGDVLSPKAVVEMNKVRQLVERGEINENEARKRSIAIAKRDRPGGKARTPTFARDFEGSDRAIPVAEQDAGDTGKLPLPGGRAGAGGSGAGSRAPGGAPAPPEFALEERKPEEPAAWYHASYEKHNEFAPREVKDFNSLGPWFTSSPEHARRIYATKGHVTRSQLPPDLNFLEFDGNDRITRDFHRILGANAKLAEAAGFKKEAAILRKTLPSTKRLGDLTKRLNDDNIHVSPAEHAERQQLEKAEKASTTLLRSPKYNKLFRQMLIDNGYDGI